MRLILMGTGSFAVPTFRAVLASRHDVAALVTRPVPPAVGRRKGPVNPVLDSFTAAGIPVLAPESVNDAATGRQLVPFHPDLFVVCDYGQILADDTLRIARCGGINLHGSLLPKYRGAAPINWAIWQGETEAGVSVIHMTPRLDGGPVLTSALTPIAPDEDAPALEHRLAQLGVEPVLHAIDMLDSWDGRSALGTPQDPTQATRAPATAEIARRSGLDAAGRQYRESGACAAPLARHLHAIALRRASHTAHPGTSGRRRSDARYRSGTRRARRSRGHCRGHRPPVPCHPASPAGGKTRPWTPANFSAVIPCRWANGWEATSSEGLLIRNGLHHYHDYCDCCPIGAYHPAWTRTVAPTIRMTNRSSRQPHSRSELRGTCAWPMPCIVSSRHHCGRKPRTGFCANCAGGTTSY